MYEYDKKSFAQILSELRRTVGLSQRKAAADLGISQALLSHYENGARRDLTLYAACAIIIM